MNLRYQTLAFVGVTHGFFGDDDAAISWLLSERTQAVARQRRLLLKVVGAQLRIANERDETNTPLVSVQGHVLRFGLKWAHPHVGSVTASAITKPNRPLFHNINDATQWGSAEPVQLSNTALRHTLVQNSRPLQVELRNSADEPLFPASAITSADTLELSYSEHDLPEGRYSVVETADDLTVVRSQYVVDNGLLRLTPDAIFELHLNDNMIANPVTLTASFAASTSLLKYYVVLKNFSNAQQAELSVVDDGAADDGRPPIVFSKLASNAFTPDDLPAESLISSDENVILFKSNTSPPRQSAVRHKLQLRRNAEVVIPHLPHAGLDKLNTDVIVYLANP